MATRKPQYELPEDRPASFDETGHHVALNPADVSGPWRRRRSWLYFGLIIFFLALPWTRFHGHQTVLIDIPGRKFALFGLTFWAHDVPLIFFILGILTIGLTFVTAIWGRIWCGWGCPQTVFIDFFYRRIERWIEGNHIQRMRLAKAPLSWNKIWKKSLKWGLFWFISTNIAHSFTAYFVGAERLAAMSIHAPWENWTPFLFVTSLTAILMFDFGWFREQFCMIMCPYGRFQSVLLDGQSLAVLYDEERGEPRKGRQPAGEEHGDCVNCYRCVQVCPTGVDIRRGLQMECVACTACIDACDEIMDQVGRPQGLIRYGSEAEMAGEPVRRFRKRTAVYGALLVVLVIGFIGGVAARQTLDVTLIRAVETPYTTKELDDGTLQVINHYRINVTNQSFDVQTVTLALEPWAVEAGVELVAATYPLSLEGGKRSQDHIFFKFPGEVTKRTGKRVVTLTVSASSSRAEANRTEHITLVGPFESAFHR